MVAKPSKVDRENARQAEDAIKVATFACRRGLWIKRQASAGAINEATLDFLGVHEAHLAFWALMAEMIGDARSLDVDPALLKRNRRAVIDAVWVYENALGDLLGWDFTDPEFDHGGVL